MSNEELLELIGKMVRAVQDGLIRLETKEETHKQITVNEFADISSRLDKLVFYQQRTEQFTELAAKTANELVSLKQQLEKLIHLMERVERKLDLLNGEAKTVA